MKVYLRWTKSSRCAFPFVFDVSEETTVSQICNMVIQENNSNNNNPTFSIVKLRTNNIFVNDSQVISNFPPFYGAYYFDFDAEII